MTLQESIRLAAAAACCVSLVAVAPARSAPETAVQFRVPPSQAYDVEVAVALDTRVVAPGCEASGCDGYVGTTATTLQFENVRVAFRKQVVTTYSELEITAEGRGTLRQAFDQRNRFCEQERHVLRGDRAEFRLSGKLDLRRELSHQRPAAGPFTMEIDSNAALEITTGSGDVDEYPRMCASPGHVRVPLAGRVETSLVGGSLLGNGGSTGFSFLIGKTRSGSPTFPFERLSAGKRFAFTLKGSARAPNFPQVTSATARVVFTPRARSARRAESTPPTVVTAPTLTRTQWAGRGATTQAVRCTVVPTGWYWNTERKSCFVLRATVRWEHAASWKRDFEGRPCAGSESTGLRWTATSNPFWVVAARYPEVAPGDGRTPTNFVFKRIAGEVTRRVSGGAWGFGCIPMLSRDCGRRRVEFTDAAAQYDDVPLGAKAQRLDLMYLTRTPSLAPYQACGLVPGRPPVFITPSFPHSFHLSSIKGPGSRGDVGLKKLFDVVEKRLLAARVGQRVVFRGTGRPDATGPRDFVESGRWSGALIFTRVS